jgi:hypothetical protein
MARLEMPQVESDQPGAFLTHRGYQNRQILGIGQVDVRQKLRRLWVWDHSQTSADDKPEGRQCLGQLGIQVTLDFNDNLLGGYGFDQRYLCHTQHHQARSILARSGSSCE